ncbi:hypothetical protein OUZ56_027694 [Daphnia magna]|uniref:Uncharacterized protein n=1 Tax=Daphnia magna TaxID=35525 RepID=A0ABQ9Z3R6_9CRUS|nr:hypothetical protein OUZ56_011999 [Daphnia magna]KAK4007511.1 hypothetical protein OUZ56_012668 [Daphnia magna]KAK4035606.1 hypothetical protein OUZ56_027694 [Daphnia magna]
MFLAPMRLIPDSRLQQTTQNDMLLLLLKDICDSSAAECWDQNTKFDAPVLLIPDSRLQQMTQNDMLLLLLTDICDRSGSLNMP